MAMSPSGRLKVLIRGSTANNEFSGNALLLYPTELPAESGAGLEPATNVVSKAFVFPCREKRWAARLAGFTPFPAAGIEPAITDL